MIGVWAALERTGDYDTADRVAILLARRLIRDLRLQGTIDETTLRMGKPKK